MLWVTQANVTAAAHLTLNTFTKKTSVRDMFVNNVFGTVLGKANPVVK